jgi:hypothetical protein
MHNIFVDTGRAWLARYIGGQTNAFISQMGVGIGGDRQNNPLADLAPLTVYPTVGARSQTDTDVAVTTLERPVAVSSSSHPITPGQDIWLKALPPPPGEPKHPTSNRTLFTAIFTETDINFWQFATVPISEIALFTSDMNPLIRTNQIVAYDTLDPIAKTTALALEIRWTIIL